jgi:hypothetical protein
MTRGTVLGALRLAVNHWHSLCVVVHGYEIGSVVVRVGAFDWVPTLSNMTEVACRGYGSNAVAFTSLRLCLVVV